MRRFLLPSAAVNDPPGGVIKTDVLIVGAGMAGLYTALQLDPSLNCLIVTKEGVQRSNSWLAQGGIAAVIDTEHDEAALHINDTLTAGVGLCNVDAVTVLVDEGPGDIATLRAMHVPFDLNEDGDLSMTREGGHTRNRIVHAGGDATGRETVKVLASLVEACPNIDFFPNAFLVDILTNEAGNVCGALIFNGVTQRIEAPVVVLCTGGAGQIYRNTTNPPVATGDGLAAALRAGAAANHMEFMQFHPTALYWPARSGSRLLVSEAVRGEGALLYDVNGVRFMPNEHPMAELAPRDVVARAIRAAMERTSSPFVWLDITARGPEFCAARFPTITAACAEAGYTLGAEPIPVSPVQHYMVGGLTTDLHARTCVSGLYACGEAASTGVHGANRLASNSMLECMVFGRRAARDISALPWPLKRERVMVTDNAADSADAPIDAASAAETVRDLCEQYAGIIRTRSGLADGCAAIDALVDRFDVAALPDKAAWEACNMATVAREVLHAARARTVSVGGHFYVED